MIEALAAGREAIDSVHVRFVLFRSGFMFHLSVLTVRLWA